MKQFSNLMQRFLLLMLTISASINVDAHDFEATNEDGVVIYYNIISKTDKTCEVTCRGSSYYNNDDYSGAVKIPETITYSSISYKVTSIGEGAFAYCSGLTSVTIPSSVTCIGDYAFSNCSGLTSIDIPNSVTSIGNGAFLNSTGLTSITIPSSVTSFGEFAFSQCSGLTSIDIPDSITSIENGAFDGCTGLTSVTIPNSVTSIGVSAFGGCTGLTSVTIPNSVISIGHSAFFNCTSLTSITIPNSVTSIGVSAFGGCTGLTSVTIPNSVNYIGSYAFEDCTSLTSVISYITDVFETGSYAFQGCYNATLCVPKDVIRDYRATADWNRFTVITRIPGIFMLMSCNNMGRVLINGDEEFTNNLDEVTISDEGENVFNFIPDRGCILKQVIINGKDVTRSVKDNQLKTTIRNNSNMVVVFTEEKGDVNGDGNVDISDVVALVNIILGK